VVLVGTWHLSRANQNTLSSPPHTAVTAGVSEKQGQMSALSINTQDLGEVQ